jgi:hypothetical protein
MPEDGKKIWPKHAANCIKYNKFAVSGGNL